MEKRQTHGQRRLEDFAPTLLVIDHALDLLLDSLHLRVSLPD
jgi:hypothetical protein